MSVFNDHIYIQDLFFCFRSDHGAPCIFYRYHAAVGHTEHVVTKADGERCRCELFRDMTRKVKTFFAVIHSELCYGCLLYDRFFRGQGFLCAVVRYFSRT